MLSGNYLIFFQVSHENSTGRKCWKYEENYLQALNTVKHLQHYLTGERWQKNALEKWLSERII